MNVEILKSGLAVATEYREPEPEFVTLKNPFARPPCGYCAGSGWVSQLENGAFLQAGIKAYGLVFESISCPICNGCSWGEGHSTDRRSDKQKANGPPGKWLLIDDEEET